MKGEWNPQPVSGWPWPCALPYAWRENRRMEYRHWDGQSPCLKDEMGLFTTDGRAVVPDVVLVPCVAYTCCGWRLGYGGGYFDAWLATHPEVTALGLAWSGNELPLQAFVPLPHDRRLMAIVTEKGVCS